MRDKQYGVVINSPNNYKENMNFMIQICTHIYVNIGQERVIMTKSFFFDIQNKSFHDREIYLVQ